MRNIATHQSDEPLTDDHHYLTGLGDVRVAIDCTAPEAFRLLKRLELPDPPIHYETIRQLRVDAETVYLDGERQGHQHGGLVRNFLEGLTRAVVWSQNQLLLLHAAALISPMGRCYLFPGKSGCGKTTLSVGLALSGWRLLTDELVGLSLGHELNGFLRPVHIRYKGLEVLPLSQDQRQSLINTTEGAILPSSALQAQSFGTGAYLGKVRVIFLSWTDGEMLNSANLSQGETVLRLMGVNINGRNFSNHGFLQLAHWVRYCGAGRELLYGDWSSVAAYLTALDSSG